MLCFIIYKQVTLTCDYFDGFVQDRRNTSALAMELRLSYYQCMIATQKMIKVRPATIVPYIII